MRHEADIPKWEWDKIIHNLDTMGAASLDDWQKMRVFCIKLAMQKLPPRQQKVMRLIFWEDNSAAQVARKFHVSAPMINKIKNSAIKRLERETLVQFFLKNPH